MALETDPSKTPETDAQPDPPEPKPGEKQPGKPADPDPQPDEDDAAVLAEKAKQTAERKQQREVERRIEKAREEAREEAKREHEEAAENAKKSELERATAAQDKLKRELEAARAEAADNKMLSDLAMELNEQGLSPASAKARDHITTAYKAQIAEGKTPDEALKAVRTEEAYLFKAPAAAPGKQPVRTQPADKGPTTAAQPLPTNQPEQKNPGDITDPLEFAKAVNKKHHIRIA